MWGIFEAQFNPKRHMCNTPLKAWPLELDYGVQSADWQWRGLPLRDKYCAKPRASPSRIPLRGPAKNAATATCPLKTKLSFLRSPRPSGDSDADSNSDVSWRRGLGAGTTGEPDSA